MIFNLVLPEFKKDMREEHVLSLFAGEDGIRTLKSFVINMEINKRIGDTIFEDARFPNTELIKQEVIEEIESREYEFVKIGKGAYDKMKYKFDFDPTGESVNFEKRVETLTTIWQSLLQRGDPREKQVFDKLIALTGENFEALAGDIEDIKSQLQGGQTQGGQDPFKETAASPQATETVPNQ